MLQHNLAADTVLRRVGESLRVGDEALHTRGKARHPTTKWILGAKPLLNNQYPGEAFVSRGLSMEAKAPNLPVQIPTFNLGGWNIPLQLSHFGTEYFWSRINGAIKCDQRAREVAPGKGPPSASLLA